MRSVSAFLLQADANDSYKVFGATENTPSSFKLLTEIDSVVNQGHGLRMRPVRIEPTAVRYIRIGEPLGDNSYSISEFQVYCQAPNPFPPKLPIVDAPPAKVIEAPWYEFRWFANDESSRFDGRRRGHPRLPGGCLPRGQSHLPGRRGLPGDSPQGGRSGFAPLPAVGACP